MYYPYNNGEGGVGMMIVSAWMNLSECTKFCNALAWLRWDERTWQLQRKVHVKSRKGWRGVDGLLENSNTSKVKTPHSIWIMGNMQ